MNNSHDGQNFKGSKSPGSHQPISKGVVWESVLSAKFRSCTGEAIYSAHLLRIGRLTKRS